MAMTAGAAVVCITDPATGAETKVSILDWLGGKGADRLVTSLCLPIQATEDSKIFAGVYDAVKRNSDLIT